MSFIRHLVSSKHYVAHTIVSEILYLLNSKDFSDGLACKEYACDTEDMENAGLIPGLETCPGGGHGNPLQYSCLGNPMDRGIWLATVQTVTKSWTRLSD